MFSCPPLEAQTQGLEVDVEAWDFGRRDEGEKDVKRIRITNRGTATRRISKVGVTCGCISAELGKKVLAGGESAELLLKLDTLLATGVLKKSAYILSDDPGRPRITIPVEGEIRPAWWLSSRSIEFGDVGRDQGAVQRIRIEHRDDRPMKLLEIRGGGRGLRTELRRLEEKEGRGWELTLSVEPGQRLGRFSRRLEAVSDFGTRPLIDFHLSAEVVGTLRVSRRRLAFGRIPAGQSKTLEVSFKRLDGSPLELHVSPVSDDRMKVSLTPSSDGRSCTLKLSFTCRPDDRGAFRGRVGIETGVADQPRVQLDYYGRVGRLN